MASGGVKPFDTGSAEAIYEGLQEGQYLEDISVSDEFKDILELMLRAKPEERASIDYILTNPTV